MLNVFDPAFPNANEASQPSVFHPGHLLFEPTVQFGLVDILDVLSSNELKDAILVEFNRPHSPFIKCFVHLL